MMASDNEKEGSIRGWLVVASGFAIQMYFQGIMLSSGLFMVEFLRSFPEGADTISWIFTATSLSSAALSPLIGYLVSKFGARKVAVVGATLLTVAMVASAFAQSFAQLMVTFGILHAIGLVGIYIPSQAMVAQYFHKRYGLANGLSSFGASIGIMTFPLLIEALIQQYGWHGAFLVIAGFAANTFVTAAVMKPVSNTKNDTGFRKIAEENGNADPETEICMTVTGDDEKQRSRKSKDAYRSLDEEGSVNADGEELASGKPNKSGATRILSPVSRLCGCSLLRGSPLYVWFLVFIVLFSAGAQLTNVWLVVHAVAVGIPRLKAASLVTYFGVTSAIGRAGHGWLIDAKIISPMTLLSIMVMVLSLSSFIYAFLVNYAAMATCSAVIGVCQGVSITILMVCARQIVGLKNVPQAVGLQITARGIGAFGLPIAGKLYELTKDTKTPFYLASAFVLLAGFLIIAIAVVHCRKQRDDVNAMDTEKTSQD
ncbi:monocarboxylate transporter 12-like [Ptychodera flava]|uniref:monocarboxylate transporter 12-like n=1 Tax=Ptychodera flava TaxID=63121 RepID=UPI00396A9C6F